MRNDKLAGKIPVSFWLLFVSIKGGELSPCYFAQDFNRDMGTRGWLMCS